MADGDEKPGDTAAAATVRAREFMEKAAESLEEVAMTLHNTARAHRGMADQLNDQAKEVRDCLRKLTDETTAQPRENPT